MSHKATGWVLYDAPVMEPTKVLILWALADRASDDGTAAWPSQEWIADRARCSTRTVRRHIAELEDSGFIRRGDQQLVAHYRSDRRPVVWDLVMDETARQANLSARANEHDRTSQVERPDTGGQNDRTTVSDKPPITSYGSKTTQEPSLEIEVKIERSDVVLDAFERVWVLWPNRKAKQAALKSWRTSAKKLPVALLEERTTAWSYGAARAFEGREGFVPYLSTWLNQERWDEEPPVVPVQAHGFDRDTPAARVQSALELGARMDAQQQGAIGR